MVVSLLHRCRRYGGFAKRKKFRDVQNNRRVAFVVDDLASINPWRARGIEIRGEAAILETGGQDIMPGFDPEIFRIHPRRIISWGLGDPDGTSPQARSVS